MIKQLDPKYALFSFAFCGGREDVFEPIHLRHLAELAEPEIWNSPEEDPCHYDILFYYVVKTFEIVTKQDKIVYNDDRSFAAFNTGLMTENGEDIYACFLPNQNPDRQKWFLKGFYKETDRVVYNAMIDKPQIARYDEDPEEFHFDSGAPIELNCDHIFDDHWDDERFPEKIKELGKPLAVASMKSAFEVTKKKIQRNPRLAVPQYYDGRIMFLLPIRIPTIGGESVTMALAIEKMPNGTYRANTIFDLATAYKKARLITKPESNWLME